MVRCSSAVLVLGGVMAAGAWRGAPAIGSRARNCAPIACAHAGRSGGADDSVAAASVLLQSQRATSGSEAFAGTTWSVLMQMTEGGSSIFTVQLLEDYTCRFSDTEQHGEWECDREWVVIEKPKGFFDQTLYFSAKLSPPSAEKPKWRLVEGVVQRANASSESPSPDSGASKGGSYEPDDGEAPPVEIEQLGMFGANEFEEALLTTLPRFQDGD